MTVGAAATRSFAADPIVEAPGPLPTAWTAQLVHCVVDESLSLPDAATLTYRDPNHELLTETGITIGTRLRVSVATVGGQAREPLFTGEVTALELDSDATGSFTVVRALSRAHRLFRGRRVRAFRNMTAADIVRKVASTAGLATGRIDAAPITYPQVTQANVSDWEFLQELAGEHGATVRIDRSGRLQFTTPTPAARAPQPDTPATRSPLVLEYGRNLMALRAVLTSVDQVNTVEVRGWNVATKSAPVARQPASTSRTVVPGLTGVSRAFGTGSTLLVTDTPYGSPAEAALAARTLAASSSAGLGEFEAVAQGNPQLRAGVPVALGNAGPAFSGRYTATAVHHVLEPVAGYRTTVFVSASSDRSLAGLVTGANARARSPRIPGLAIGIVTDVREPGRAERGWVRLRFPWLSEDYVSDWARTVQFGGHGGGGVFSPEVNDEVLVGFELGCLDRPYVLGGLYNGVDSPSPHDVPLIDPTSGRVNRRSLVSRSGNRIELLDVPNGATGVRLSSGDERLEVRLDEQNRTIELVVYGAGRGARRGTVTMTDRGISIDAGEGDLALRGRSVSVDGSAEVRVDGGAQAVLRGRIVRIN
ncbi:MAG TPA: VgrG-related protein [Mycobacteriales bacterium]|nr:VgrG-related protein [Mycobacteriales bacterium]